MYWDNPKKSYSVSHQNVKKVTVPQTLDLKSKLTVTYAIAGFKNFGCHKNGVNSAGFMIFTQKTNV